MAADFGNHLTYHMDFSTIRDRMHGGGQSGSEQGMSSPGGQYMQQNQGGSATGSSYVNVAQPERIVSAAAGAGLLLYGVTRQTYTGAALALIGGMLLYRGATGHCSLYRAMDVNTAENGMPRVMPRRRASADQIRHRLHERGIHVKKAVTINRPASEVYQFWRRLENLPKFMIHLQSVEEITPTRSRWVTRGPAGMNVQWEADIVNEEENRVIAWRSVPGSMVDNAGSVRFVDAPGGRGTEVHVHISYVPPAGRIGAAVATLFRANPHMSIDDDLLRLKGYLETGEIAVSSGEQLRGKRAGMLELGY